MLNIRRTLSLAALIFSGLFIVQPLHAGNNYMVIFKSGKQLEAKAAPVVKGAKAYFMTVNGQEFVVKAELINLEKSAAYNAELNRYAVNASDINSDDDPITQSLGRASDERKRDLNQNGGGATVVTARDLSRTSGTDLTSIDSISPTVTPTTDTNTPAAETPRAAPAAPTSGTVPTANGPATINYTISVPQPAAPAPAPQQDGGN